MGVNIGLALYIYKWKATVEKFEGDLYASYIDSCKAYKSPKCCCLYSFACVFFFSHQASRSVCLWWVVGKWKRAVQRHCYLLVVSVCWSAVLLVESSLDM